MVFVVSVNHSQNENIFPINKEIWLRRFCKLYLDLNASERIAVGEIIKDKYSFILRVIIL